MFWIGMIVGIVLGIAALFVIALLHCTYTCGSWQKWSEACGLLDCALDNRESIIVAYHEGEILDEVRFPEE